MINNDLFSHVLNWTYSTVDMQKNLSIDKQKNYCETWLQMNTILSCTTNIYYYDTSI